MQSEIEQINHHKKEILCIKEIAELLEWDMATSMPNDGAESRGKQLSAIYKNIDDLFRDKKFIEKIEKLLRENPSSELKKELFLIKREIDLISMIPKEILEEYYETFSLSFNKWREAKINNDYEIFKPYLIKMIQLKKQIANYQNIRKTPYDSVLYRFIKDYNTEEISKIFSELKKEILIILEKIKSSEKYQKQKYPEFLDKKYNVEDLKFIYGDILEKMNINHDNFVIDYSMHGFSKKISFGDYRIAVRKTDDFVSTIGTIVHETGHILYDMNLPEKNKKDFLGQIPSISLYESTSRFWEIFVGMSKEFWKYYFEQIESRFELDISFKDFYFLINRVRDNCSRHYTDELHYILHIILRFELEIEIFNNNLNLEKIKEYWNRKHIDDLGIIPLFDAEGILQDIHWSVGYFGYFPSYLLGTICSAQFYNSMNQKFYIKEEIKKGDFRKILNWLNKNIHSKASYLNDKQLLKEATGEEINPKYLINYLQEKYYTLYEINED